MKISANDIKKALESIDTDNYEIIGFRADDHEYKVGEECSISKSFECRIEDFSDDTEYELLNGTCSTLIYDNGEIDDFGMNIVTEADFFDDMFFHVIAGYSGERGVDDGEMIIKDAIVIAKIITR